MDSGNHWHSGIRRRGAQVETLQTVNILQTANIANPADSGANISPSSGFLSVCPPAGKLLRHFHGIIPCLGQNWTWFGSLSLRGQRTIMPRSRRAAETCEHLIGRHGKFGEPARSQIRRSVRRRRTRVVQGQEGSSATASQPAPIVRSGATLSIPRSERPTSHMQHHQCGTTNLDATLSANLRDNTRRNGAGRIAAHRHLGNLQAEHRLAAIPEAP